MEEMMEERKRKAQTKADKLDDGGRILETQGKGTTSRRVDIWTCREEDHLKKERIIRVSEVVLGFKIKFQFLSCFSNDDVTIITVIFRLAEGIRQMATSKRITQAGQTNENTMNAAATVTLQRQATSNFLQGIREQIPRNGQTTTLSAIRLNYSPTNYTTGSTVIQKPKESVGANTLH